MKLDDYLKGETAEIESCSVRSVCPLGAICGPSRQVGGGCSPLYPSILKVDRDERLWTDMRFEQRVFILRKGAFVCMAHDEGDNEIPLSLYGKGIAIGLAEVYLPREASAQYHLRTVIPGSVCSLPMKAVKQHLEMLPSLYQQTILNSVLTNQVASMLAQVKMTSKQSYCDRVLLLLLRLFDISDKCRETKDVRITHGEVASLIGSDRVTATRALHKARDEGYIELGYTSIKLNDKLLRREDFARDARAEFYPVGNIPRESRVAAARQMAL